MRKDEIETIPAKNVEPCSSKFKVSSLGKLLLYLGLLSTCLGQTNSKSNIYEADARGQRRGTRWWRVHADNINLGVRYLLGEDPLLMAGLYEGDILPDDGIKYRVKTEAMEKNAVVAQDRKWERGVIPYQFSDGYSAMPFERFLITRSMRDIESRSCVKFVERSYESDYVKIVFDSYKCYSNVGRKGGEQKLSLGFFCVMFYDRGNVYHELFHVLGFHHEHNRPDRDNHVSINWNNIKSGADKNFRKRSYSNVDSLGLPYDLDSVMHYSPHAFSKLYFVLPTISSHDRGIFFARSRWPSQLDYSKLNRLYHCRNR